MSVKDALDSGAGRKTGRRWGEKEGREETCPCASGVNSGEAGSRWQQDSHGDSPVLHGPKLLARCLCARPTLRSIPTLYTNPLETTCAGRENHGALSGEPGPAQGPESTWIFQKDPEVRPVLVLGPFFPPAQGREKQVAAPRSPSLWPTREASDRAQEAELKPAPATQDPNLGVEPALNLLTGLPISVLSSDFSPS